MLAAGLCLAGDELVIPRSLLRGITSSMAVESHQCSQGRERGKKEGDDYPARIYVTFQYDSQKVSLFGKAKYEAAKLIYGQYPPLGAINYIWESRAPVGTTVPNPYTDRVT